MRALCISIAVSIAAASVALAYARAADLPAVPFESMPPIQHCVVESLTVDGLPVVQYGWCYWDEEQKRWVPLSTALARHRVFGIRPIEE